MVSRVPRFWTCVESGNSFSWGNKQFRCNGWLVLGKCCAVQGAPQDVIISYRSHVAGVLPLCVQCVLTQTATQFDTAHKLRDYTTAILLEHYTNRCYMPIRRIMLWCCLFVCPPVRLSKYTHFHSIPQKDLQLSN